MNKSELEHVWHSVTSVLENEFRTRGWLPPHAARIEALEAALRKVRSYSVDIEAGRINYRPKDHIQVIDAALAPEPLQST